MPVNISIELAQDNTEATHGRVFDSVKGLVRVAVTDTPAYLHGVSISFSLVGISTTRLPSYSSTKPQLIEYAVEHIVTNQKHS